MENVDYFDNCIVGAGVVGLAIARELALLGQSILVIEQNTHYGSEISSRNSEVIHAGIYYPTDSLKAKLCVEGKTLLYDYCEKRHIAHRRVGKLIVATTSSQFDDLAKLKEKAEANGVMDLEWITQAQLRACEPNVAGVAALLSPSTGILDSHALMTALLADVEANGGLLSLNTQLVRAAPSNSGFRVDVTSVGEDFTFECGCLINAAGLGAQAVAKAIAGLEPSSIPELYYCKGDYFALTGKSPFNRLIYPMPEANTTGLGIHATLDMSGQARFGPDITYIDEADYQVLDSKKSAFAEAIRQYYPAIDPDKLSPAYAGIRPKLQAPGGTTKDFVIEQPIPGLINLFGIESPGLTASLAIARYISSMV